MTQFDTSAYRAITQSPAQPAQPRSAGVRRAQAFSGRGLTFWLQWLTANVALTLLLVTLANIKTGALIALPHLGDRDAVWLRTDLRDTAGVPQDGRQTWRLQELSATRSLN